MTIKINSFPELVKFIKDNDFTPEQISRLLAKGICLYYFPRLPKEKLLKKLDTYWHENKAS